MEILRGIEMTRWANFGKSPFFHSSTLSARTRKDSGILSPSALAVLRLATSSNFAQIDDLAVV
jgi:hypothetical protein